MLGPQAGSLFRQITALLGPPGTNRFDGPPSSRARVFATAFCSPAPQEAGHFCLTTTPDLESDQRRTYKRELAPHSFAIYRVNCVCGNRRKRRFCFQPQADTFLYSGLSMADVYVLLAVGQNLYAVDRRFHRHLRVKQWAGLHFCNYRLGYFSTVFGLARIGHLAVRRHRLLRWRLRHFQNATNWKEAGPGATLVCDLLSRNRVKLWHKHYRRITFDKLRPELYFVF